MDTQLKAEGSSLYFPMLEIMHVKEKYSSCGLAISPSSVDDVDMDDSITRDNLVFGFRNAMRSREYEDFTASISCVSNVY